MAAAALTATAIIVDRDGRPVVHVTGQTRVTASGAPLATAADAFLDGSGQVLLAISPPARVRTGGVEVLSVDVQFVPADAVRVVSDQTRVRIG